MATYTFPSQPIYNPDTDQVVENVSGGIFAATPGGSALPIFDVNGTPIASISSNGSGMSTPFTANSYMGFVQFGSLAVPVVAQEVATFAVNAQSAITTANNALAVANQALSYTGSVGGGVTAHGALTGLANDDHLQYHNDARGDTRYYPRAAADAALAAAITTSSAGDRNRANHSGQQSVSSVTNLEPRLTALESASTGIVVWRYTGGAWPTLSSSKPAGATLVIAIGPTYPISVPSWVGLAASQVPLRYSKVAVA